MNNNINKRIEVGYRAAIAHFGPFNAEGLGLTVDAFGRGALIVNPLVEGPVAIQGHAHASTQFPIDIFDTAFAFGKLSMVAALAGMLRKEQWAAEALGTVAIGVIELKGGMHGQPFGTHRGAIGSPFINWMGVLVECDGSNPLMPRRALRDIPRIKSGIGSNVGGIGI